MSISQPRRRILTTGLGAALLLLGSGGGCGSRQREPIRFATNPWPGYDPLYVARDKGYFADAGLEVVLVDLTSIGASRRAFERGQVDGCGATLVEILLAADQSGLRPQIAAVVDYSSGADVLIAPHQTGGVRSKNPNLMGVIDRQLWDNRRQNPEAIEAELRGDKGRGWLMRWLPSRAHRRCPATPSARPRRGGAPKASPSNPASPPRCARGATGSV